MRQAERVRELERTPEWNKRTAAVAQAAKELGVGKTAIQESLSICEPMLNVTQEAIRIFEIVQEYRESESNGLDDDMPLADIVKAAMSWHTSRKLRT